MVYLHHFVFDVVIDDFAIGNVHPQFAANFAHFHRLDVRDSLGERHAAERQDDVAISVDVFDETSSMPAAANPLPVVLRPAPASTDRRDRHLVEKPPVTHGHHDVRDLVERLSIFAIEARRVVDADVSHVGQPQRVQLEVNQHLHVPDSVFDKRAGEWPRIHFREFFLHILSELPPRHSIACDHDDTMRAKTRGFYSAHSVWRPI